MDGNLHLKMNIDTQEGTMGCESGKNAGDCRSVQQCLICERSTERTTDDSGLPFSSPSPSFLEGDLHVFFILRHVLELPSEQLENFLGLAPACPLGEWVAICQACNQNYVDKCKRIFVELMEVKRRFWAARTDLIEAIKKSAGSEGETGRRRRNGRKKKQIILDIQKETRSFVSQNAYFAADFIDPFIAGDLVAREKLAENKLTRKMGNAVSSDLSTLPAPHDKVKLSNERNHHQTSFMQELDKEVKLEADFDIDDPPSDPVHTDAYCDPFLDGNLMPLPVEDEECNEDAESNDDDFGDDDWEAEALSSGSSTGDEAISGDDKKLNSRKLLKASIRKRRRSRKTVISSTGKIANANTDQFKCDQCNETFSTTEKFREHQLQSHHANHKECTHCSFKTDNEFLLIDHMNRFHSASPRAQKGQKPIQCEHCDKSFTLKSRYLYHLGSSHGLKKKLFTCSFEACEKSFLRRHHLKEHEELHRDLQIECKICGLTFQKKRAYQRHVDKHKQKEAQPFHCSLCPARYARSDHLKTHFKKVHEGSEGAKKTARRWNKRIYHKCDQCGLTFALRHLLQRHVDKMHGGLSAEPTVSEEPSDEGTETNTKKGGSSTKGTKKTRGEFKCDQEECKKIFSTARKLRCHQIHIHKTNLYSCEECGWKTANANYLPEHKKRHHGDKNDLKELTCPTCGKVMGSTKRLRMHIAIFHENAGDKFQCEHCGKEYADNIGYLNHLGSAHGIKDQLRFTCSHEGCGMAFFKKSQLVYHEDIHKEPQYQCHVCGTSLQKRQHFQRHVKLHELKQLKPYRCEHCPSAFARRDYLRSHLRSIHKMDMPKK